MSSRLEPSPARAGLEARLGQAPPPLRLAGARREIARHNRARRTRVVVLDDDPTGTQTVNGVPVVLEPDDGDLRWALTHPSGTAFVLTNSRALAPADAVATGIDLGRRLARLATELELDLRCISRSDSTLRGHFPDETEALAEGLRAGGTPAPDGILLCPCYPEAGRLTVDNIQWVRGEDGRFAPAAATEFARDLTFGYVSETLPAWVRERYGDRSVPVRSIGLDDVRAGGPGRVSRLLAEAPRGAVVIANAADEADLDVLVLGLQAAEDDGRRLLCRTAPSFVGARGGLPRRPPVAGFAPAGHGLVVVGSHTSLTTRQLRHAVAAHDLEIVELDVGTVLAADGEPYVRRTAEAVACRLRGADVALVTTRALRAGRDGAESLAMSVRVSRALARTVAVAIAQEEPSWVLAKGGITSHDIARHGVGVRRAEVVGQLFDGMVSTWRLLRGDARPPLPLVVFPGNVGGERHLTLAIAALRQEES
jgi:uncharacterized protein YgbK (DUF1537 family)